MGSTKSKSTQVSGDPQVQILNHLESNSEAHVDHDVKLTVILVLVAFQLALQVFQLYKRYTRTQALKAARSVANVRHV